MLIQAIIIDDEELSSIYLKHMLQNYPNICIKKTYMNEEHILADLRKDKVDVVFLDIEMPGINGIDLAEEILSLQPSIHIVFVTAHSEYAVKAFELNSVDYLLKPVTSERLEITIKRLTEAIATKIEAQEAKVPLTVKFFNEFQVLHKGELINFRTAKGKELFAYLFSHMDTYINRDLLIEKIWPGTDYKKAKINLHTNLSFIRKTLESIGYSKCLTFSNQSYCLSLDPVSCDVFEFDHVYQTLNVINRSNIHHTEKILQLYTGAYMELNAYEWTYDKSQEYHRKVMLLLNRVIEYYENLDANKALYYLEVQRKINPYLDENIQKSINLYIKQGNKPEAIKLFNEYKRVLQQDLGIKPDKSITEMYHTLSFQSSEVSK